jgi:hypothetical protein
MFIFIIFHSLHIILHDMTSSFPDWPLYDMSTAVLSAPLLGGGEVEFPISFHSHGISSRPPALKTA